jgi:hypothetical protein
LTTTGDLYACESRTNFDTIINRQQSAIPIQSIRLSSETTASLTSLAGSKEQAAHLDDSGTSWSSDRGSAWSLSDRMIASAN